ncbi:MAG TPA: tetratricopeptide repeat protein [Polyangia bacterium]|jgi:tetratricopeptide (TPR) repeat protein
MHSEAAEGVDDSGSTVSAPELPTAVHRGTLHPAGFVGRDGEFQALDAALERAVKFRAPQFVTVLGPLGMGKTRLWAEWLAEMTGPGLRVTRVALSALGPDPATGNLIGALLRQRFGIAPHHGPEAALVQFRSEMQRVFGDRRVAEVAALLGRFLGFDLRESPLSQALATTPNQGADLARAVLCRFLEQDAHESPLILAVDDLHLADDESLDILERLPHELGEAAVVVLVTARHDLLVRRPDWGRGQGSSVRLDLPPLSRRDLDGMIRSVLDATSPEALPTALVDRAVSESAGNPYLLEQLLHVFSRQGVLVTNDEEGWWFDAEKAEAERVVLAPEQTGQGRIASLSPSERDVLARAAVFGPVFWTGGVVALGRLGAEPSDQVVVFGPDPSILESRATLAALASRDLLQETPESSLPGDVEWTFKHPSDVELILATLDGTLLAERRRFAAQWLESRGGGGREARFEMLGELYERGGDGRRAAYCFLSAAEDARHRAEAAHARTLYLRAVRLMASDDAVAKMDAHYALGDLASRLGRTREALVHFQDMLRLAWRLDLPAKGGAAHVRLGRLHAMLGEHRAAVMHLEVARELFEVAGDLPGIASTLDDVGRVHLLGGEPEASLECHRAAFQVRDQLGDDRGKGLALARMGQVEHETGDLVAAEGHIRQAIELRRRAGDRQGMVASLLDLGALERDLGRVEQAISILEDGQALARELGERLYECSLAIALGDCWLTQARPADARPYFLEAKEIASQFGAKALLVEASRGLAEVELAGGAALEARDEARAAFELAEKIGAPPLAGAALRVVAAAVGMGAPGDAELGGAREMFDRAVEILSNVASELELGRTLAAYAEFEERVGRRAVARDLRRQANLIREKTRTVGTSERLRRGRSVGTGALLATNEADA